MTKYLIYVLQNMGNQFYLVGSNTVRMDPSKRMDLSLTTFRKNELWFLQNGFLNDKSIPKSQLF